MNFIWSRTAAHHTTVALCKGQGQARGGQCSRRALLAPAIIGRAHLKHAELPQRRRQLRLGAVRRADVELGVGRHWPRLGLKQPGLLVRAHRSCVCSVAPFMYIAPADAVPPPRAACEST